MRTIEMLGNEPRFAPGPAELASRLPGFQLDMAIEDAEPNYCRSCGRTVVGPDDYSQTIPCPECPKGPK